MKKIISTCIALMVSATCSISAFAMEVPTNTTIQDLNGVRQYITDAQEYFADCFVYWIKNRGDGKKMAMLQNAAPETYHYFKMLEENDWKPSLSP